jgi:hypothetical protein
MAVMARIRDVLPLRRDQEDLEAHVYAGVFASEGQRLGGHLRTRERDVPAIRLFRDGDRLGSALEGTMYPYQETAKLQPGGLQPEVWISLISARPRLPALYNDGIIGARFAGYPG